MRIINRTLGIVALVATLVSCEKEKSFDPSIVGQGGNTINIQGDWKFTGMGAKTEATLTGNDPGTGPVKIVSISEYTSENNSGTVKFDATKMISNELSYSINSKVQGLFYENNVLVNSIEAPFSFQMPPSSSSSNYKLVGKDSIYFEGGSFMIMSTGTSVATQPSGAKFTIEGNKLTMVVTSVQSKVIDTLGLRVNQVAKVNGIATFQKL